MPPTAEASRVASDKPRHFGICDSEAQVLRGQLEGLDLDWLEAFARTIELGGQTKAAEFMGISQSEVSRHLTSLQGWVRYQIFEKPGSRRLTQKGEMLFNSIKNIELTFLDLAAEIRVMRGNDPDFWRQIASHSEDILPSVDARRLDRSQD